MSRRNLTTTGADHGAPYVPGEPIRLWDGPALVGTVQSVEVLDQGASLRLGSFLYADTPSAKQATVRRVALFEITHFVLEACPAVTEIWFDLDHHLATERDGVALASIRSRLLHSMGAEEIKIIPALGDTGRGHFALEAVWRNTAANRAALASALEAARQAHRDARDNELGWGSRLRNLGQMLRF